MQRIGQGILLDAPRVVAAVAVLSASYACGASGHLDGSPAGSDDDKPPWRVALHWAPPPQVQPDLPSTTVLRDLRDAAARGLPITAADFEASRFVVVGEGPGAAKRRGGTENELVAQNRLRYDDVLVVWVPRFVGKRCQQPDGTQRDVIFGAAPPPLYRIPKTDLGILFSWTEAPVPCDFAPASDAVARFRPSASPRAFEGSSHAYARLSDQTNAHYAFSSGASGQHHYPKMLDHFDFAHAELLVVGPAVDGSFVELHSDEPFVPPPGVVEKRTRATLEISGTFERCSMVLNNGESRTEGQKPPARPRLDPSADPPRPQLPNEAPPLPRPGTLTYVADRTSFSDAFGLYPVKASTTDVVLSGPTEKRESAFCDEHLIPKVARTAAELPIELYQVGSEIDFSRTMVAWFGPIGAMHKTKRDLNDQTKNAGGLALSIETVVQESCPITCCGLDCYMDPHFQQRQANQPPYTVTDHWEALSDVYLLPRTKAPLVVRYAVKQTRNACAEKPQRCEDNPKRP